MKQNRSDIKKIYLGKKENKVFQEQKSLTLDSLLFIVYSFAREEKREIIYPEYNKYFDLIS